MNEESGSRILMLVLLMGLAAMTLGGCGSSKVVTRVDPGEQIDLSGNWNDTDSRFVAEALVNQATTTPWVEDHSRLQGSKPTIIVGDVVNKTAEHIPTKTFIADLERSFINTGRVRVVASAEEREAIRSERADQQEFSLPETMKRWGREQGADYMLLGQINAIYDREEGDEVKYYQVDCYFVDLEDNTKIWTGYKKIKKFVGRDAYKP